MHSFPWWALSAAPRAQIPCPRLYRGNMCGVRVPGLSYVDRGSHDPSLVVSWIVFRYPAADRQKIYRRWKEVGAVDVLVSWPDARGAGLSAAEFVAHCQELVAHGFLPCHMLCSKDFDPADVPTILASVERVLPALLAGGLAPRVCIGWELSLWLSPTQVQQLIDAIAPRCVKLGVRVYVHFQQGYGSFGQPDTHFHQFWNPNMGKLTGVLHQRVLTQNRDQYRYDSGGLYDILLRFAGNANCSPDSGFGHPFDLIAFEITAEPQFNGAMSESDGDDWGRWAMETPKAHGPAGWVGVMGSGNGQ